MSVLSLCMEHSHLSIRRVYMYASCAGRVPSLCREGMPTPLTDLKLGSNLFTGSLDVSWCTSLVSLEAQVSIRGG